jgi:DNA-binding response OmpR family regulator
MLSPKMVLIGGDENQYKLLEIHLEMAGFDLLYAPNVVTGLCMIEVNKPELILVDVGLPVSGDWDSCRRVREASAVPIIILSDGKDEADVLHAFKLGIDDYLQKPYSPAELIARATAIIRRSAKETSPPNQVASGDVLIDLERKHVLVEGQRVELTPKEFHLLKVLATHPNNTIPTSRLLNEVWGMHYDDDGHFVKQYIWNLRKKIEGNPKDPQHLITRRGFGYLFK